jgi:hypothetical protein
MKLLRLSLCAAVVICSAGSASAQHYWVDGVVWFCPTPVMRYGECPSLPHLTQFDVLAGGDVVQIRLNNGAVGYTDRASGYPWSREDPDAKLQKFLDERQKSKTEQEAMLQKMKTDAAAAEISRQRSNAETDAHVKKCAAAKYTIGMTVREALDAGCGKPFNVHTTETAYGTHMQLVLPYDLGYLYFDDGHLVTIQR